MIGDDDYRVGTTPNYEFVTLYLNGVLYTIEPDVALSLGHDITEVALRASNDGTNA
jgi:hypothetical protein